MVKIPSPSQQSPCSATNTHTLPGRRIYVITHTTAANALDAVLISALPKRTASGFATPAATNIPAIISTVDTDCAVALL